MLSFGNIVSPAINSAGGAVWFFLKKQCLRFAAAGEECKCVLLQTLPLNLELWDDFQHDDL